MTKFVLTFCALILLPQFGLTMTRSWYQKAHVGGDARHRCTGFSIGNKGYYGGGHINSGTIITYSDYWEYDPATNSWTQIADFGGGLRYHSSAFVIGNAAYVGCGEDESDNYTADFWKYVPEVNTWIRISDIPGTPRRGGTAFTIDGIGYYGLGQSLEGYHSDFYAYNPTFDSWTPIAEFIGEQRSAAVNFVLDDKAYVGTGHIEGDAVSDFYMYDPVANVWEIKANVGGSVRQDAMAFSIDGKGYIGMGSDNFSIDFGDIWEYDTSTDTWTQIEDFGGAKRRYAVTFVIENIAYLAGGTDGTNFKDLWAYAPTVSIEETVFEQFELKIYPNPSSDLISISIPAMNFYNYSNIELSITDLAGKTYLTRPNWNGHIVLSSSDFGYGMFFVNLSNERGCFYSRKIIFTP